MKLFLAKWALCFLGLLIVICCSCASEEQVVTTPTEEPKVIDTRAQVIETKPLAMEPVETKPVETKPVVPDVVGKTAPDAAAAIIAGGFLTMGTTTYEPSDTIASGRVIAQRPPAGTSVALGSSVDLVLSLGRKAPVEQKPKEQPVVEKPAELPVIVAEIGDYTITEKELEKKLITELRAYPDECMNEDGTINAEAALLKMIAEKAMIIHGRELNYLQDPYIQVKLKELREKILSNLLWEAELAPKLTISESEIEAKIKSNPKLKPAQAAAALRKEKANRLTEQFYRELYKKLDVQKLSGNIAKAARIYQRLLMQPKEPQKLRFVRRKQIQEEMTPEERNLVLAKFDNGRVTLEDWFDVLCRYYGPPSRPKDLYTPKGVEKFLDKIMKMPVYVAEAKLRGFDKDQRYLKRVREWEDTKLRQKAINAKYEEVGKPTEDELRPYFDANKDKFKTPEKLKIDQIWCEDLPIAQKAKAQLSSGKDFQSVKQALSLAKGEKAINTSASREGIFFEELWNAEPSEIVGPIKGFYMRRRTRPPDWQVKWRIVKILLKTPSKEKEYSSDIERQVSDRIRSERRVAALAKYKKELLDKYSYKIYYERIKDINPLNVP